MSIDNSQAIENLKNAVVRFLMTEHDYLVEIAEKEIEQSMQSDPDMWNENADAKDLANHLASDDDE